ncbi:hypothetical protein CPB83DRAFT_862275 [Crepidotus variabilis]|uniref:Uncharacterized protein n=1 Tax=Crepidotus variabilis TaxID=179855 RepID=A0A9P6E795_9AGAR|nr:hypothetical protein CPB83DRAFT_862275 [Crepidotus variabilis]
MLLNEAWDGLRIFSINRNSSNIEGNVYVQGRSGSNPSRMSLCQNTNDNTRTIFQVIKKTADGFFKLQAHQTGKFVQHRSDLVYAEGNRRAPLKTVPQI